MARINVVSVAEFLDEEATLKDLKNMLEEVSKSLFELSLKEEGLTMCINRMDALSYLSAFLDVHEG